MVAEQLLGMASDCPTQDFAIDQRKLALVTEVIISRVATGSVVHDVYHSAFYTALQAEVGALACSAFSYFFLYHAVLHSIGACYC